MIDKRLDVFVGDMTNDNEFRPLGAATRENATTQKKLPFTSNWRVDSTFRTTSPPKKSSSAVATGAVPLLQTPNLPKPRSPAKRRNTPHPRTEDDDHTSTTSLRRFQSASKLPTPHPLAELMRNLTPPMTTTVIHSMASLSRAGMERGHRKTNQDCCFAFRQYIHPHQAIAAVLDGHGPSGHLVSGHIKQHLPQAIADQLRQKGDAAAGEALSAAFLEMQTALRGDPLINARLSGSTAVVTLLQGRRLTTAHVGDSRAVLLRRELGGGWRGIALTQDHKPTSAGELTRILAAGGRVERLSDGYGREVGPHRVWLAGAWVPGLAMSRALGDFVAHSVGVSAEPEVHCCELDDRDEYLVVASDGVWEFMTVQEVADVVGVVNGGGGGECSAESACKAVVEAATERWMRTNEGVVDDISVVVAKLLPRGALLR